MLYSTISSASLRCHDFISVSYLQAHYVKKKRKKARQLYLFTALWVCVSYWHRVLNASTAATELPRVFVQLFFVS